MKIVRTPHIRYIPLKHTATTFAEILKKLMNKKG